MKIWCFETDYIKKQVFFEEKLSETIGKPKKFCDSLNSLGMQNKRVISNFNAIEENDICLSNTSEKKVLKIMTNIGSSVAAGIDKLSCRCLQNGTNIILKPISPLCNLSISQRVFLNACKVVKPNAIFKKWKKTDPCKGNSWPNKCHSIEWRHIL